MVRSPSWLALLLLTGCNGVFGIHRHQYIDDGATDVAGNSSADARGAAAGSAGSNGHASRGGTLALAGQGGESTRRGGGATATTSASAGVTAWSGGAIATGSHGGISVAGALSGGVGPGGATFGASAGRANIAGAWPAGAGASTNSAGRSSSGASTGGVASGGKATGGVATGGVATGGVATGGAATGGAATGGVNQGTGGGTVCMSVPPGLSGSTLVSHLPANWAANTTAGVCRDDLCTRHCTESMWEDPHFVGQNCLCVWDTLPYDCNFLTVGYTLPVTAFSRLKLQIIGDTEGIAVYLTDADPGSDAQYCTRLGASSGLTNIALDVADFGNGNCDGTRAVPSGTTFAAMKLQMFRANGTPTSFGFCVTDIAFQ